VADVTRETDGSGATHGRSDPSSWQVRRPEWVAHVLDDEAEPPRAVLLHLPSGRRTALSDTGTRVWQVIVASEATGTTAVVIGEQLAPEYQADPSVITHDVAGLVAEMVAGEWLEVVPTEAAG
jgi:hypothetical protein